MLVAEVSVPCLGIGYEIGKAEEWEKEILCLFLKSSGRLSAMIEGNKNFSIKKYEDIEEALAFIDYFLSKFSRA